MSGWRDGQPDDERRDAAEIMERVFRGEPTVVEAAVVTGVSERQCYRIKAGVVKGGAQGVVHGNQGQAWRHCTILHLFRKQGLAPSPGPAAVMHQLGFLKPNLI